MKPVKLSLFQKETAPEGLCCLYLLPNQLIATHVINNSRNEPTVTFLEVSMCQPQSVRTIFESIIKKHHLENVSCSWMLHPGLYQLFLLDQPSVPESEIASALRWQIKDMIHFPAENAWIEYFHVPSAVAAKNKIFVAAAQTSELKSVADTISEAGVNLQVIDIPEFALRNIAARYGDTENYLGLMAFRQSSAQFIITYQKNILLSRQFTLPEEVGIDTLKDIPNAATPPAWLQTLIADIQRSFEFCQNQQKTELPTKLLVSIEWPAWTNYLGSLLNIPTELLRLEKKIQFEFVIPEDEYLSLDYLLAIGGALRATD